MFHKWLPSISSPFPPVLFEVLFVFIVLQHDRRRIVHHTWGKSLSTTAYDQHALKAFEVNALDYLLKPIAPERLARALQKLRTQRKQVRLDQIFLREGERCWIVRASEIELMESEGNYTRIYFRKEHPLISGPLAGFEERLDPQTFFRASRKHIINLNSIESAEWGPGDNLIVKTRGGQEVALSRRHSLRLREVLGL
jgi:two-component system LytT family response regulator